MSKWKKNKKKEYDPPTEVNEVPEEGQFSGELFQNEEVRSSMQSQHDQDPQQRHTTINTKSQPMPNTRLPAWITIIIVLNAIVTSFLLLLKWPSPTIPTTSPSLSPALSNTNFIQRISNSTELQNNVENEVARIPSRSGNIVLISYEEVGNPNNNWTDRLIINANDAQGQYQPSGFKDGVEKRNAGTYDGSNTGIVRDTKYVYESKSSGKDSYIGVLIVKIITDKEARQQKFKSTVVIISTGAVPNAPTQK